MAAKSSVAGMMMGGMAVAGTKVNASGRKSEDEKARALKKRDTRTPAQKKADEMYETLTPKQKEAFDVSMTGRHMFISGGGGVGKSHILKVIVFALRNIQNKNVIVCAPTGVAAVNAGDGTTLHRQLQLPLEPCFKISKKGKISILERANGALKCCDTLIIDEISMVRIDVWDCVYKSVQKANKYRESKGLNPIQVIVEGDFFQIQPIIKEGDERELLERYYNNPKHSVSGKLGNGYAFNSVNWGKMNFHNILLTEVIRQKNPEMIYHLNKIREGNHGFTNYFNHVTSMEKFEDAITLHPYNIDVQEENRRKLEAIKGREYVFKAQLSGNATEDDCEGRYELRLKIGAKIMFLVNDNPQRKNDFVKDRPEAFQDKAMFVNGTTGIIRDIYLSDDENGDDDYVTIEINPTGEVVNLKRNTNEVTVYEEKNGRLIKKTIGYWRQLGIALGFSCSVHKSQGLSLSRINIDPRAFSHGMLYVALSRCTSVEGIHLEDFIREDALIMDEEVANFYKNLKEYILEDSKRKQEDASA